MVTGPHDSIECWAQRLDVQLHQGDLPDGVDLGDTIAVDTETMGLDVRRDQSAERFFLTKLVVAGKKEDAPCPLPQRVSTVEPVHQGSPLGSRAVPTRPRLRRTRESAEQQTRTFVRQARGEKKRRAVVNPGPPA